MDWNLVIFILIYLIILLYNMVVGIFLLFSFFWVWFRIYNMICFFLFSLLCMFGKLLYGFILYFIFFNEGFVLVYFMEYYIEIRIWGLEEICLNLICIIKVY